MSVDLEVAATLQQWILNFVSNKSGLPYSGNQFGWYREEESFVPLLGWKAFLVEKDRRNIDG